MKCLWRKWLGLSAGILVAASSASADDRVIATAGVPRTAPPAVVKTPAPVTLAAPTRTAFAESRPVILGKPRFLDEAVKPVAFRDQFERPVVRAKGMEMRPTYTPTSVIRNPASVIRTPVAGTTFGMDNDALPQPGAAVPEEAPPPSVVPGPAYLGYPGYTGLPGSPVMTGMPPMEMGYGTGINPDRFDVGDGVSHQFTSLFFFDNEFLAWQMKGQNLPPLVTAGLTTTMLTPGSFGSKVLIGGQEVDMDTQLGYRVRAGLWLDRDHSIGLEGSYFFLCQDDLSTSVSSSGFPALGIPFFNGVLGLESALLLAGNGTSGVASSRMLSRLWGAEANIRANLMSGPCGFLDLIVGFRAIGLDDSLELAYQRNSGTTSLSATDTFATRNRYYGGQVGLEWERRRNKWSLNVLAKVGLGGVGQDVDIKGSGIFAGAPTPIGVFATTTNIGTYNRTECAYHGEAAVKLGYQISNNVRATVGYNYLYLSEVVRAGEQIDRTFSATRPAFPFNSTTFWAQGFTLGLELRY